jgi:nucleotide-binding universal stress UspA family protein
MADQKILLPYNFTLFDRKGLDFVVRTFAPLENSSVTVLNFYTPLPDIETSNMSITGKLKEQIGYLAMKIQDQEKALKDACGHLLKSGFDAERVRYVFKPRKKDVAVEILDLIRSESFDLVVLNRKPGKITRFFTGSVSSRVIATLKGSTVCIVT